MDITQLKIKYLNFYNDFKKRGSGNKILLLLMLLPPCYYVYILFNQRYFDGQWYKYMPYSSLLLIVVLFTLFWMTLALTINSISFVNIKKVRSLRNNFKYDFYSLIKTEIPEIKDYIFNQKIHVKTFKNSHLFDNNFCDYIGDDWFKGKYKDAWFELCELHVFRLFKNIFHGIFVHCKFETSAENRILKLSDLTDDLTKKILDFECKFFARIKISNIKNNLYIAAMKNGRFFESKNSKSIEKIETDHQMLIDLIYIIKAIIENRNIILTKNNIETKNDKNITTSVL